MGHDRTGRVAGDAAEHGDGDSRRASHAQEETFRAGLRVLFAVVLGLVVFGYGGAVENLAPDATGPAPESSAPPAPGSSARPTPDPREPTDPSPDRADRAEHEAYLVMMRSYLGAARGMSEQELIALGHDACSALDRVAPDSPADLEAVASAAGLTAAVPDEAGVVLAAATSAYCREWSWLFRA